MRVYCSFITFLFLNAGSATCTIVATVSAIAIASKRVNSRSKQDLPNMNIVRENRRDTGPKKSVKLHMDVESKRRRAIQSGSFTSKWSDAISPP